MMGPAVGQQDRLFATSPAEAQTPEEHVEDAEAAKIIKAAAKAQGLVAVDRA